MLKTITSYIDKYKVYAREKELARRKIDAVHRLRGYFEFQEANHPAVRKLYGETTKLEVSLDTLDLAELEALNSHIPAIYPTSLNSRETTFKADAKKLTGTREIKYADHVGRTTFHYYTQNSLMDDREKILAAYADIAQMYGFIDGVMRNQFIWFCIRRTVTEVTSAFDLRRMRNTMMYYPDTKELSVVFDFSHKVKTFDHAWRILILLMAEKAKEGIHKAAAERLTAEIRAAGWDK